MQIGRQIRLARLQKNLTQTQLAEAVNLSVPYISHVERGKKRVSLDALVRIAQALEVTLDQLLSGVQPQDRVAYLPELGELLADCTLWERRILRDVTIAVKKSLRETDQEG